MSILAAEEIGQYQLGIMLIWAGLAVVIFAYCRVNRVQTTAMGLEMVPNGLSLLVMAFGLCGFWMLSIGLLAGLARQIPGWTAGDELSPKGMNYVGFFGSVAGIAAQWGWLIIDQRRTREMICIDKPRIRQVVIWGLSGAIIALPLVWVAMNISEQFMQWIHYEHPTEHALLKAMDAEPDLLLRILGIISAVILAPVFEEILFRGFLQTSLKYLTGHAWIGILITSIAFAIIHESWSWFPIFALSLLLGLIFEYSRTLWSTILVHALFNGYNVILWSTRN